MIEPRPTPMNATHPVTFSYLSGGGGRKTQETPNNHNKMACGTHSSLSWLELESQFFMMYTEYY